MEEEFKPQKAFKTAVFKLLMNDILTPYEAVDVMNLAKAKTEKYVNRESSTHVRNNEHTVMSAHREYRLTSDNFDHYLIGLRNLKGSSFSAGDQAALIRFQRDWEKEVRDQWVKENLKTQKTPVVECDPHYSNMDNPVLLEELSGRMSDINAHLLLGPHDWVRHNVELINDAEKSIRIVNELKKRLDGALSTFESYKSEPKMSTAQKFMGIS